MADDDEAQIIMPPNLLRAKVGNKPGPRIDEMVATAEAALDELKEDFEGWIQGDMQALREAVASLREKADPAILERIKTQAHEIKGQGTTYGYPLLTVVGDLLYRFIDAHDKVAAQNLNLIDAHVAFMSLVLKQEIHDEGDAQAQRILDGLQNAAKKALGAATPAATQTRAKG